MKHKIRLLVIALAAVILAGFPATKANAKELDRIKKYEITASVNNDATVNLKYHIDWEVLDSTSEGPLEWVKIGIPNEKTITYRKLTDNIKAIKTMKSSGEYFIRIDFDRAYKKGEVVSFDFEIVQDYMYQMNKYEQGYTVFEFIPGWFDEIKVENITVSWATDKATSASPTCTNAGGYFTWKSSLGFGEIMNNASPIAVTYSNDSFAFDESKTIMINDGKSSSGYSDSSDAGEAFLGFLLVAGIVVFCVAVNNATKYNKGASLGTQYDKKITRTKVTYFANCPGCGAIRENGQETCAYCGRSMIQSEEKIEEKDVPKEEKGRYDNDGVFSYGSSPNTYIRVHVTKVPRPVSRSTYSGSSHSSCAHSSCACACACACAGGGRAGCSAKDFYNTNLKLRDLMFRDKFGKKVK